MRRSWVHCTSRTAVDDPCGRRQTIDYAAYFPEYIRKADCARDCLDKELASCSTLHGWAAALRCRSRDGNCFSFLVCRHCTTAIFCMKDGVFGLSYHRPFFMRVAMGLAVREIDREARGNRILSSCFRRFDFMCSTPTLFNAGTLRPQLSSCFLTTIEDDLGWDLQGHQG